MPRHRSPRVTNVTQRNRRTGQSQHNGLLSLQGQDDEQEATVDFLTRSPDQRERPLEEGVTLDKTTQTHPVPFNRH
ncbi:hypothetical protein VTJ04DRAFT_4521 [Mycothermus thermophilus]|uniref:uncharacterized protein n=1 Tax=Humicola insolens TaxID=85995 RepID=UPI0037449D35